MCLKTEPIPDESASCLLTELAMIVHRLRDRLSVSLIREVLQTLEGFFDHSDASGDFLRVLIDYSVNEFSTASGARRVVVTRLEPSHGLIELVTAMRAFDGDLESVCKRHGFLRGTSSPTNVHLHRGDKGQAGA